MPMYMWRCDSCGSTARTIEKIDNRDTPPNAENTVSQSHKLSQCAEHKWERILEGAPGKAYAEGWGGVRKGFYGRG